MEFLDSAPSFSRLLWPHRKATFRAQSLSQSQTTSPTPNQHLGDDNGDNDDSCNVTVYRAREGRNHVEVANHGCAFLHRPACQLGCSLSSMTGGCPFTRWESMPKPFCSKKLIQSRISSTFKLFNYSSKPN